jgi:phospholipid-transporting ATPase
MCFFLFCLILFSRFYLIVQIFLLVQFSRIANLYTLCTVCLCFFSFSPVSPIASLTPLLIVLTTSGIKEIIEDYKRKQQDRDINERPVDRLPLMQDAHVSTQVNQNNWRTETWSDVVVGDIVRVVQDAYFPGDLLLLCVSEPTGRCFVETANLDGENNLKLRSSIKETSDLDGIPSALNSCRFVVDCEPPNTSLYTFDGTMALTRPESGEAKLISLNVNNVLLRGTQLRQTEWYCPLSSSSFFLS